VPTSTFDIDEKTLEVGMGMMAYAAVSQLTAQRSNYSRTMKKKKPRFMMIYRCASCGMDSGFTEKEKPVCRYCDVKKDMTLISKKEITPEVMAERLKELSDRMFSNLRSAFESMTEEDKVAFPEDEDPEKMMLTLLAKAKKFKEDVEKLELKQPKRRRAKGGTAPR